MEGTVGALQFVLTGHTVPADTVEKLADLERDIARLAYRLHTILQKWHPFVKDPPELRNIKRHRKRKMLNHAWTDGRRPEVDSAWKRNMSRSDHYRSTYNALGLTDIGASGNAKQPAFDATAQPVLTRRISLDQGQFHSPSTFTHADQPPQDSIFSFYVQGQDATQPRIHDGHHSFMPNSATHVSQPIYFLPGPPYPASMRHPAYAENAGQSISAFSTYIHPGPVYQTAHDDMGYSHMPMQPLRPVSSSSSESPDEILMTPFMVQGSHSLNATPYLSYIQAEPTYASSVMPMSMQSQPKGISGMYTPSTGRTSAVSIQTAHEPRFPEIQSSTAEQPLPPPLRRRHTDSLPFSDGPLKRPAGIATKPYDSTSDRLRRPLSAINHPTNTLGMGFLGLDNSYVAKQRIACQGCREKKLKCTGGSPVCYNCSKKGRTQCKYVSEVRRRGPGKKRLAAEARAVEEGFYADPAPGIPAQYAFWAGGVEQS